MHLEKWALIAEVLGGIGIIVSIVYLGYEVSRNVERLDTAHHLTLSEQLSSATGRYLENESLAEVIVTGNADYVSLKPAHKLQYQGYMGGVWDIWENAYQMRQNDLLSDEMWFGWNRALCRMTDRPGAISLWTSSHSQYYIDTFVPIVDECYRQPASRESTKK